jgi:prepilin-type N-terminal cleavage/methylation domain-containing protein
MEGPLRRLQHDQQGFTIVEVMIAATVLLVGMVGIALVLNGASLATTSTKAREQAVSLQRELVETARSVPYEQLSPNAIVAAVQIAPGAGLGDAGSGSGWTIRRRGITYTVTLGVCAVDDPSDGTGTHDSTFCATGAGNTTSQTCLTLLGSTGSVQGTPAAAGAGSSVGDCGIDLNLDGRVDNLTSGEVGCVGAACGGAGTDSAPDDYKRIVSLVRWDRGTGKRFAVQTSTVPNPGLSGAPDVTALDPTTPLVAGEIGPANTAINFHAVFSTAPATSSWYLDGTNQATVTGPGSSWDFGWPLGTVSGTTTPNLGEVLDGSYVISAKAFDGFGAYGSTRASTVKVNRRVPYPPPNFEAGRNGAIVDLQWSPNRERDIEGYRVYRVNPGLNDVLVCSLTQQTSCQDLNPPNSTTVDYYVVAVDKTNTGALREGDHSPIDTVTKTNTAPTTPTGLTLTASNGNVVLNWNASSDPDAGDSVDFYRIYRDGQTVDDRYDRTQTGSQLTFTDTKTNGVSHVYYVVAVDTGLRESGFSSSVSG